MANFCSECGSAVDTEDKFCEKCGQGLLRANSDQPVSRATTAGMEESQQRTGHTRRVNDPIYSYAELKSMNPPAGRVMPRGEGCFLQTMNAGCLTIAAIVGLLFLLIVLASL